MYRDSVNLPLSAPGKRGYFEKNRFLSRSQSGAKDVLVRLLGGFEVRSADGDVRDLPGQKDRALLTVLALSPGAAHSRDKLAGLLWSDRDDVRARDSLKHAVSRLRKCLAAGKAQPIFADRQSVRLDPAAVDVDVSRFEEFVHDGTPAAVEQAIALYGGELLDGIVVRDASFEDWLLVERRRLADMVEAAATILMRESMSSGASDRAAAAARRLLSLDPLREEACRTLMRLHADNGETAQALKLYESLRARLHGELGVTPEPETLQLYKDIRNRPDGATRGAETGAGVGEATMPTGPPLPDKPSIAVLAFENLSDDPEQAYFADGIVEEIITALSRMHWLFVIARNSSFAFKGRAVDVKQIGQELGVRYVLEGSVRKAANRVRIMGRLIDASAGTHLWADRFDGALEDVFDLQDRVTASVVGAIAPRLQKAEIDRAKRKPTENLDAYDYYLRGLAALHEWQREPNREALSLFAKAIELDSDFAAAYGMSARCYSMRKASGWMMDPEDEIETTIRLARRAAVLGQDDAVALSSAGIGLAFVAGKLDEGGALIDQALELDPNLAWAWLFAGWVKVWRGEPDEALERIERALRFSPHDPHRFSMYAAAALAHFFAGRLDQALSWARNAMQTHTHTTILATSVAAASAALSGEQAEAEAAMDKLRRLDSEMRLSNIESRFPIRRPADVAIWANGLRKAGLPE